VDRAADRLDVNPSSRLAVVDERRPVDRDRPGSIALSMEPGARPGSTADGAVRLRRARSRRLPDLEGCATGAAAFRRRTRLEPRVALAVDLRVAPRRSGRRRSRTDTASAALESHGREHLLNPFSRRFRSERPPSAVASVRARVQGGPIESKVVTLLRGERPLVVSG
jgi:hypothetical protein